MRWTPWQQTTFEPKPRSKHRLKRRGQVQVTGMTPKSEAQDPQPETVFLSSRPLCACAPVRLGVCAPVCLCDCVSLYLCAMCLCAFVPVRLCTCASVRCVSVRLKSRRVHVESAHRLRAEPARFLSLHASWACTLGVLALRPWLGVLSLHTWASEATHAKSTLNTRYPQHTPHTLGALYGARMVQCLDLGGVPWSNKYGGAL